MGSRSTLLTVFDALTDSTLAQVVGELNLENDDSPDDEIASAASLGMSLLRKRVGNRLAADAVLKVEEDYAFLHER